MSETRQHWSRRRLLQYSGVGIGLAVAGCSGSNDDGGDGDDGGNGDEGNNNDGDEGDDDGDEPAQFELAGDGAAGFREWLGPAYTLDSQTDGRGQQLFQLINYEEVSEGEMENQLEQRETFADRLNIQPEQIERELLLGPIERNLPYRAVFGTFDSASLAESFETSGFEQTAESGEFVIFDGSIAISDAAIIEHANAAELVSGMQEGFPSFEDINDEMETLLELVPAGPLTTINNRRDYDDLVLDGMTILELAGSTTTHSIRTMIFTDESAATSERVREIDIEGSARDEVVTEEIHGRVAMIESRQSE